MKTEDLKQLAEYMGYKTELNNDVLYLAGIKFSRRFAIEYNPLTNAEQCLELMEKLIKNGALLDGCHIKDENNFMVWMDDPERRWEGKTINEAVTLAAIEAIKQ